MGLFDFFGRMPGSQIVDPSIASSSVGYGPGLSGLLQPTEKDKRDAIRRGLLAAGLGILSAKTGGNTLAALGQGGMQGIGAYDDSLQAMRQAKMQEFAANRQQKQDVITDTNFQNQQTVFAQNQQRQQAMQDIARKHQKPDGSFDSQGYVNDLYQYDPDAALKYTESMARIDATKLASQQNKSQFGGQEILKDEAGNLFYGTSVRDPSKASVASSVVAVDGSSARPQGKLQMAGAYGLTAPEKVAHTGKIVAEKTATDAAMNLPAYEVTAKTLNSQIDAVLKHEGRPYATGWASVIPTIPNTAQADFRNRLAQIDAQSFLKAFQDLKGGGAITEIEGQKATQAINRMKAATTDKEFDSAAQDLKELIQSGVNVQREIAGRSMAAGGSANNAAAPAARNEQDILSQYGIK